MTVTGDIFDNCGQVKYRGRGLRMGLFSLYSLCSTMFSMVVEEWFARCWMACATVGGVFGGMAIQQSWRWTELSWYKWRAFISDSVEIVGVAGLSGLKSGRIHCMMCTLKFNDQRHTLDTDEWKTAAGGPGQEYSMRNSDTEGSRRRPG